MARTKKDAAEHGGAVEVRVLFACDLGKPDEVVAVDSDQVDALSSAGLIDAHPDAVAYAKSLKG